MRRGPSHDTLPLTPPELMCRNHHLPQRQPTIIRRDLLVCVHGEAGLLKPFAHQAYEEDILKAASCEDYPRQGRAFCDSLCEVGQRVVKRVGKPRWADSVTDIV